MSASLTLSWQLHDWTVWIRLGRVRSPLASSSRQIVLNTFDEVAGRSSALLRTPDIVRKPSFARAKLMPLRGARTVSLDDDKRPSFDLWRLTYSPFTSKTTHGAPSPLIDRSRSFARWDLPVPFRPVMMFRPPSSPPASIWTGSPSLWPTVSGLFPPFMIRRLIG